MQRYLIKFPKGTIYKDSFRILTSNGIDSIYLHNVGLRVIGAYVPDEKIKLRGLTPETLVHIEGLENYVILADPIFVISESSPKPALPLLLVQEI